jgi:hypothetical protein
MRVIQHDKILIVADPDLQALGSYDQSASAFEKAISLLPLELSAQEKTLKKQCEEGLGSVRETMDRLRQQDDDSFTRVPVGEVKMDEMPWNRASTIMDELISSQNPDSSVRDVIDHNSVLIESPMLLIQAWIINNAYRVRSCSL